MEDFQQKLEELNPNVTLSVELPHNGNGNLYQARTTVTDGVIFYGRGDSEEDAIIKCCQKAVKHLMKNNDSITDQQDHLSRTGRGKQSRNSTKTFSKKRQPQTFSPSRPPRRSTEDPTKKCKSGTRELELRGEMGDVLDRVAQWNSRYQSYDDYENYSEKR